MSWRGNYNRQKFVSSSSSGSSSYNYDDQNKKAGSMHSVPPPPSLTTPNAAALMSTQSSAFPHLTAKQVEDKRREEEYANLMYYGAKTEKDARKKKLYDDEYLEAEDSDDDSSSHHHRRKSGSSRENDKTISKPTADDDEDDELDAFMAGINEQAKKDKKESEAKEKDRASGKEEAPDKKKLGRADIDDADMQESYFTYLEEHKEKLNQEDEEVEYDEDGNVIWSWKKVIDPLPAIDHTQIQYPEFHKNFYAEHEEISAMNHVDMQKLRHKLGLKVGGIGSPRPVCSFAHFGFDKPLMDVIRKSEFEHPTPIQSQAIPAALSGRDVLGIAKTGSGKTAAYLWPAIVHIMDQPDLKEGDGPIAVVVVPTRELAIQVYQEAKKFCKAYNINVICAYGGGSKWEQSNELKGDGAELVICTPGRMIDLVKIGSTNFLRTTFLVFDEADRMFDMGFEAQVKSISDHIRPDRQCLMFSATFKSKVERLAREALKDPVRIVQGEVGEANEDVIQTVEVLSSQDAKWNWLTTRLVNFGATGKVLIFVTKKSNAEDLASRLKTRDFQLVLLHGDMLQAERNEHLQSFRRKMNIMVATDVAARGLDIPEIRTVINYDMARDIDTHVHRIGRTGRAGQRGWAYTLVTDKDFELVGHLVRNLESVNQEVPPALMNLAMKASWFRAQRGGGSAVSNPKLRTGLGYVPKTRTGPGVIGGANLDPLKETAPIRNDPIRAGPASSSSGNRLNAMKQAFKQSFSATFHASQQETSKLPAAVASDPRPEWKRKIDEINARFAAEHAASQSSNKSTEDDSSQKKKSRWE